MKKIISGIIAGAVLFNAVTLNFNNGIISTAESIPYQSSAYVYNGHSYFVYSNVCDTWEEAKAFCEKKGGYLAVINDDKENKAVYDYVQSSGYENAYFGYTDKDSEGEWKWIDGSISSYENWDQSNEDESLREPNNGEGFTDENYAMYFFKYDNGTWNDGDFGFYTEDLTKNFICEWDSETASVFPEYEKKNFNNHTYQIIDRGLTWTEAKEYCESIGGHLVTINSQKEQTFLTSIINDNESAEVYSIGLYYDDGDWIWVDDSPVTYTNWNWYERDGERYYMPDSWFDGENYGYMYIQTTEYSDWMAQKGMWNDAQDYINPFICEWDITLSTPDIEEGFYLKYTGNLSHKEETVYFKNDGILDLIANNASSTIYQPELAYMLSILSSSAYTIGDIDYNLQSLGFADYDLYNYYNNPIDPDYEADSCAYSIAQKTIENNKKLVLVTVRGSFGGLGTLFDKNSDWNSNLNIFTQELYGYGKHTGFKIAMEKIYLQLEENLDNGILNEDTKYIITGHSRGAGVANLLAKKLNDEGVSKYNIFDYNFACPDVSKATPLEWNLFSKYDNIFNICVAGDPVTIIPGVLGNNLSGFFNILSSKPHVNSIYAQWGKYGQTRWFSDNWDAVTSDLVIDFHASENYVKIIKDIESFSEGRKWSEFKRTEIFNNLLTLIIMCPVDVQISDSSGNILATVVNNEVTYNTSDEISIMAWTEDDHKYFIIFGKPELNVSLKGTDEGTMDCIISSISNGKIETESLSFYEDVELYDGKEMFLEINDKNSQKIELSVVGDTCEIINPVYYQASCIYGDINEDGSIDSSDASLVLAEYAKIQTGGVGVFTDIQLKAADVSNDGVIDSSDASKILAYYAMVSTGKEPTWD